MGFLVEVNSMLRLIKTDPQPSELMVGKSYTSKRPNNRIYLINIPILMLAEDWTVLGYCLITEAKTTSEGTEISYRLQNAFTPEKSKLYTEDLLKALHEAGYL